MTVTYTAEVANASAFGSFAKLLLKWRGSIYKLIWKELIAFLCVYYALSFSYRLLLNENQQRTFESVVYYCSDYGAIIPLSFVLGFYVTNVMSRWWEQYISIPTPDSAAIIVASHLHGTDERSRIMRRTIMRYICLSLTVVLSMISPRVKRRFPTLNELRYAGLLLPHEQHVLEELQWEYPLMTRHWMPLVWATNIVTRARKEGRISEDYTVKTIVNELNKFRGSCVSLLDFDSTTIPLVYTQVVTMAVYSFFISQVIGHQWLLDGTRSNINLYFPLYTTLQFFFYMGWLKVAESMMNPFGDDDDDFDVNWMTDRNLQVSYMIVDEMYEEYPELTRDLYWDDVVPMKLPYQAGSKCDTVPLPSTDKLYDPKPNMLTLLAKFSVAAQNKLKGSNKSTDAGRTKSTPAQPHVNKSYEEDMEPATSPEANQSDNVDFERLRRERWLQRQSQSHARVEDGMGNAGDDSQQHEQEAPQVYWDYDVAR